MYRHMNWEEWDRVIKFMICSLFGLVIGKLIGYPDTPTIAVSAILVLYVDRGAVGSVMYSVKRISTQIIAGGVTCAFIFGLRALFPWEGWIIRILAVMGAIFICLPLEARFHFAPLTVTTGNSILIIAAGSMESPKYYLERVLFCVLGAIIAHLVIFVIMPRENRYTQTLRKLSEESLALLDITGVVSRADRCLRAEKALPGIHKNILLLEVDKKWHRPRISPEDLQILRKAEALLSSRLSLDRCMDKFENELTREFSVKHENGIYAVTATHEALLKKCFAVEEGNMLECPFEKDIITKNPAEIHVLHLALEYSRLLSEFYS